MTTTSSSTKRGPTAVAYEAPNTQTSLLVAALECTISGRPLPDVLRPSTAITNPTVRPFAEWIQ